MRCKNVAVYFEIAGAIFYWSSMFTSGNNGSTFFDHSGAHQKQRKIPPCNEVTKQYCFQRGRWVSSDEGAFGPRGGGVSMGIFLARFRRRGP